MTVEISDSRLTNSLAQGCGEILKGVRNGGLLRGLSLGDAGDEAAQEWIARVLEQHRPQDGMLSEEASDDLTRLKKDRVWIVDPLDGTKEFATGRQDWAVHIALVENGIPIHAAVGLPDLGVTFKSSDVRAVTGPLSKKFVVSRNRPPKVADYIAEKMGYEIVGVGSAGAKAMHVLLSAIMTAISTPAVSTSGIRPLRWASPRRPACTAAASMAPKSASIMRTRSSRISSSAAPS